MQPVIVASAWGDLLHCHGIAIRYLGRSAPSFDYNKDIKVSSETSDKDIKGKTVKRWR
jgi:hypothetical protein